MKKMKIPIYKSTFDALFFFRIPVPPPREEVPEKLIHPAKYDYVDANYNKSNEDVYNYCILLNYRLMSLSRKIGLRKN